MNFFLRSISAHEDIHTVLVWFIVNVCKFDFNLCVCLHIKRSRNNFNRFWSILCVCREYDCRLISTEVFLAYILECIVKGTLVYAYTIVVTARKPVHLWCSLRNLLALFVQNIFFRCVRNLANKYCLCSILSVCSRSNDFYYCNTFCKRIEVEVRN